MAGRPRVIGLTGGIGTGKSTVAALLRELGAEVFDADQVAREVVRPGQPAHAEIVREFGPDVLGPDGQLDRKKMAALVFSDEAARRRLNQITHPRIAAEAQRLLAEAAARGARVVVYEAALIVENGLHHALDGLIVVSVPESEQIRRVMARDGMAEEDARRRIAAQGRAEDKAAAADYLVSTGGTLAETRQALEAIWRDIQAGAPRRSQEP